jgi:hypothetical protein
MPITASSVDQKKFKNLQKGGLNQKNFQIFIRPDDKEIVIFGNLSFIEKNKSQKQLEMTNTSCKISRLKFQLKIIKVKTGLEHILALSDINSGGKVFSWGSSNYGQLGLDTRETVQFPQQIMSIRSYTVDIEVAGNTNLILDENNRILTFGSNQ